MGIRSPCPARRTIVEVIDQELAPLNANRSDLLGSLFCFTASTKSAVEPKRTRL
jgi:hypothetical protein